MSEWKSAVNLREVVAGIQEKKQLFDLFAYSRFCLRAFFTSDFVPDEKWVDCIQLTQQGEEYLNEFHKSGQNNNRNFEVFALFQLFFHHDIFIDYTSTNFDLVHSLMNDMHFQQKAKWPYVFGNELYHKHNNSRPGKTDHLDPIEVEDFLKNTPQGVFQIGNIVTGPLGFLFGLENRYLPPTLEVLLWHCSDPGCQARHIVELRKHKSIHQRVKDSIVRFIADTYGPPSEWWLPIIRIGRSDEWHHGRLYYELPGIIGDCLIGEDRRALLEDCIKSKYNNLIINALQKVNKVQSTPAKIVQNLTAEEQHQILLLLPDNELISRIDMLIAKRVIKIPPSDSRGRKTYSVRMAGDEKTNISSLGIRSTGHPAIIELASAIWSAHETLKMTDDLSWRLRGFEDISMRHSIMKIIHEKGPVYTVKELIIPYKNVINVIVKKYNFQIIEGENEVSMIHRLLWKLGFDLPRYEDGYQLIRDRIQEFSNCVLQAPSHLNELEKSKIRGIGVNLFVSVECFIEELICYNVWLLSSDHFTGTRFKYTKYNAHLAVVKTLGYEIISGNEKSIWSLDGANSLGTLIVYLNAFRNWLRERPNIDKTPFIRSEEDYPHYATDSAWVFPFKHTALWADNAPQIIAAYTEVVEQIFVQLAQADLTAIRNGLDHKREDNEFPSADKMLVCVSRLQQAVEIADAKRFVPKLFWKIRMETDGYSNICDTLADYRGSTVSLWSPQAMLAGPEILFGVPYLIAPIDFINHPNTMLVFKITAKTEYSEYWKNYPRRLFIPPKDQQITPSITMDDTTPSIDEPQGPDL